MTEAYEIEIKTLLGDKEHADALIVAMKENDPYFQELSHHKQLNHYFEKGDLQQLVTIAESHVPADLRQQFVSLARRAKDYSLRTREADGRVLLVLKASIDDTTSSNGTARLEFEAQVHMSLYDLDQLILNSGFSYQAKWSRERREFKYKGVTVDVDKNAGYGYLAEFELIVKDPSQAQAEKTRLRKVMTELGVKELSQERLARMFDYYNAHWSDYYGTDKIFNIE